MTTSPHSIAQDASSTAAPVPAATSDVERVRQLTQAMFPGPVEVEADEDPEEPAERWWNFRVECSLAHAELRELRSHWHESVHRLGVSDASRYSLQVHRP